MSTNMQRYGEVLSDRMKKTSGAAARITTELGTINSNLSLSTDSLPTPIPKGDYMINGLLTGDSYETSSDTHSHEDVEEYTHTHTLTLGPLKSGDRVLVMWCGNEPVVVAVVVGS